MQLFKKKKARWSHMICILCGVLYIQAILWPTAKSKIVMSTVDRNNIGAPKMPIL